MGKIKRQFWERKAYTVDVLDQVIAELVVHLGCLFTVRSLLNIVLVCESNSK
jgi:hypothetical protein